MKRASRKEASMSSVRVIGVLVTLGLCWAQVGRAQDPDRGKAVYAEQKCKMCHSVSGEGNAKGPLDGVGNKYKTDEIKAWISDPKTMAEKSKAERKPPMKSYASLPAPDIDALVAYLGSLKK
jgi:cytochrome c2